MREKIRRKEERKKCEKGTYAFRGKKYSTKTNSRNKVWAIYLSRFECQFDANTTEKTKLIVPMRTLRIPFLREIDHLTENVHTFIVWNGFLELKPNPFNKTPLKIIAFMFGKKTSTENRYINGCFAKVNMRKHWECQQYISA